ncbi:sulfite exporter TauE/SafE family protein [Hyphococcus sp.]|uniref:sulfite exporter TauE/SafE family protein n=1 Tax=Hyphococcus sp. TaxID=2038636 RepID=UPI003CCC2808
MQLYLPIAEIPVDPFVIVAMGAAVGFLSGMFGVGGGFLMTPLLIFYGIPPAVAVGTEASQIVASSVSGVLAHLKRKTVDFQMGGFLVAGGAFGSLAGILIFRALRASGQIEIAISISYVLFLGVIGALMMMESVRALLRAPEQKRKRRKRRSPAWMASLPFAMRFRTSGLYISPLPPIVLGFCVGILAAIMGVGGGFIMVPAMLYILNMPTNVVVGTSLFQIIFVTAITTVLHAAANQTVDVVLALLLLAGGVIGAQFGARAGVKLKAEQLRALLALIVLAVCARLLIGLALPPDSPFILETAS